MKKFTAICIFVIGMLAMLPSTASRSDNGNAPPGSISFVEHPAIAPAIAFVQITPFVVEYNLLAPVTVLEMEKGGESIEYSLITSPMIYLNDLKRLTTTEPYTMLTNLDFRICYTIDVNYRNQNYKLIKRNKDWVNQVRIRSDGWI